MESFYSVTWNQQNCGKVSVKKQGLYYHFHCRCMIDRDDFYRLILSSGGRQENLGILIPSEGVFTLTSKLPVKQIEEGEWSFKIVPKRNALSGCFVPISPEEPFAYISRLKDSFLTYRDGQPGIWIPKMQE